MIYINMSANAETFNFIRQNNMYRILLSILSKYVDNIDKIIIESRSICCFEVNNVLIQYLTKYESIDVIMNTINKETVRMIGTAMFTCKL